MSKNPNWSNMNDGVLAPFDTTRSTSACALVFPEQADYNQLALQILQILQALQCCHNFVGGCYKETRQTKKSNESSLPGWVHMTGCLTSNTDEVSKMGGGGGLRICGWGCGGSMSVTMATWHSTTRTVWSDKTGWIIGAVPFGWGFFYIPNEPFVFCTQNLNPTSDRD